MWMFQSLWVVKWTSFYPLNSYVEWMPCNSVFSYSSSKYFLLNHFKINFGLFSRLYSFDNVHIQTFVHLLLNQMKAALKADMYSIKLRTYVLCIVLHHPFPELIRISRYILQTLRFFYKFFDIFLAYRGILS